MSGILFLKSQKLSELKEFYSNIIKCEMWMEQADCILFKHGNFLFGFCQRGSVDTDAMLTFFYPTREEVDDMYGILKSISVSEPVDNEKYDIYQFFARDPEGRMLEFQYFRQPVAQFLDGVQLLNTRRSVRKYLDADIPKELLEKVFDLSRFAPTARNNQPYYFKVIRDREKLETLAGIRSSSSAPIGKAPMAIAICSDPDISGRHIQDGCIAAYHLMLAAWHYGLGTCWIADMDREEVKKLLDIPQDHYVATITPMGFPARRVIECPPRKDINWYLRDK